MEEPKQPLQQRIASFFTSLTGLLTATAALIGAVVGILTATGVIGGGNNQRHATSTQQNQATWATQANAICAKTNDTIGALPNPHTIAPSDIANYLKTSVVLEQRMLRELNALPTPRGNEAQVVKFLQVGARMSDATSELADDVTLGNLAAAQQRATQLSRLNTRFNNAAIALGARTCAEGSSLGDVFGGSQPTDVLTSAEYGGSDG
jgi:hypothetical protein